VVSTVARYGGMVSAQPWHDVPTVGERLSAYFNLVALMGTGVGSPTAGRRPPAVAFGPVLLTTRDDYQALGGPRSVAADVVDDLALAAVWARAGRPVQAFAGRSVATFRMYPRGLSALVEGWTKNVAAGARAVRPVYALLAAAWMTLHVQAIWWLLRAVGGASSAELLLATAVYALSALQLWWMLRRVGSFGWPTAVLFPVSLALFLILFLRSALLVALRRPVRWKGREVPASARSQSPGEAAGDAVGGTASSGSETGASAATGTGTNTRSR
jgi:4,4'-diaponeurosporenoate glycosyltransferase